MIASLAGAPAAAGEEEGEEDKGSMYRYIWVEKRFGRLVGEIQRVKGTRFSVNGLVAMLFVGYQ